MTTQYYRNKCHMKTTKIKTNQDKPIDVTKLIRVDMVFDGENTTGWVHTHGMWELFQLPDLEIRKVSPLFLMADAGRLLNHIAQYMLDGKMGIDGAKPVALGQTMGMSRLVIVKFELSAPLNPKDQDEIDGHFTNPRWNVVPIPEMYQCANPKHQEKPS